MAVLSLTYGQTAKAKSTSRIVMPHKDLTIKQEIKWQRRIIKHDRWVIRTAKVHPPHVVKWHKAQLRWTLRELSERLSLASRSLQSSSTSIPSYLYNAFLCIHRYEGAWNANTGNGYYGGLQMDMGFQSYYGSEYLSKWGTADKWPVWAQMQAAVRAYKSGRGFYPWPNTARVCGLI